MMPSRDKSNSKKMSLKSLACNALHLLASALKYYASINITAANQLPQSHVESDKKMYLELEARFAN